MKVFGISPKILRKLLIGGQYAACAGVAVQLDCGRGEEAEQR
jgi:hypothetical protein